MNLSDDIIIYILEFLNIQNIFKLFLNKKFKSILENEYIWKQKFNQNFYFNNSIWRNSKIFLNSLLMVSNNICPLCKKSIFKNYILTKLKVEEKKDKNITFIKKYSVYHQKCLEPFQAESLFSNNFYQCPFSGNVVYGIKGYVYI